MHGGSILASVNLRKTFRFESFSKDAASSLKVLDEEMSFANSEDENMKEKMKHWEKSLQDKTARVERKLQGEIETLRDEKLYMEVYQRRENLRFYGIREASGSTEENVKEVLVGFMRQVFFAGHIPQVTNTGHSIFAPKQHKNSLNSANRTRQALMYIFSKNIFRLGAQF